jgi:hypothetical protein
MNPLSISWSKVAVLGVLGCAIVAGLNLWHSVATKPSAADHRREYVGRVRDGLSEVRFASAGSSRGEVRASIQSLAHFIRKRSGVDLSPAAIAKLAAMEERVLNGDAHRISGSDLGAILSQSGNERVAELTDPEIDHAVETLRGFDAPDLPDSYRRGRDIIYIRADRGGPKVSEKVVTTLRSFRDQAKVGDASFKYLMGSFVSKEVDARVRLMNEAAPEQFAGGLDSFNAFDVKLTPSQALLVAYSVVSDDHLLDSEANQHKYLDVIRGFRAKNSGGMYPGPEGHFAFGTNGYLYSAPLDLFMGDRSTDRLLQLIEERSAK